MSDHISPIHSVAKNPKNSRTSARTIRMIFMRRLLGVLALLLPSLAQAQGTLSIALQQQFAFTNCLSFANACGTPLSGGLLYFYQVGTVATVQNSFQDTGLTLTNPWPLVLDQNGRIPMFYLANGAVHVRLTDSAGVVQFDYPNMLVIGPSSGGGGGGSVDPTTIASTGDVKSRLTSEFLTGWVKANAQTVGNATSGATQRANADTQSLFVYLWTNCPDAHCPVPGGRGASGLADFSANKQITLPDLRGRICSMVGLDDMGNSAAGRVLAQNVTSGGGDAPTTPNATVGENNHTLTQAQLPVALGTATSTVTDPGHTHVENGNVGGSGADHVTTGSNASGPTVSQNSTQSSTTGITVATTITNGSGGGSHNVMTNALLGTCFLKL